MSERYVLIEKKAYPVDDLKDWATSFEKDNRRVAQTQVGDINVSTVFLGLNHGWGGKILLFETMAFDPKGDEKMCERYETWEEAERGHWLAVLVEITGGTYG